MKRHKEAEESSVQPPRETGRVRKAIRWFAIAIGGLLAILVIIVVVFVAFGITVNLSRLSGRIESAATEALGRKFTIEGPVTLVPTMPPAAEIEGVRIANPEGWPEGDLAKLNLARARLRILPLLSGEVRIEEITIEGLQISLETNAEDEPNWLLKRSDDKPAPEEKETAAATGFIELGELSLRDIAVTHRNATTGQTIEFQLKEVSGSARNREPMQLLIHGAVQQVPYEVTFKGGSLAALMDGAEPWPMDIAATVAAAKLTIAGDIAEPLRGKGLRANFDFKGPMMKDLERVLGTKLPPIPSFDLRGRIEEMEGKFRISDLKGNVAKTEFGGSFEADVSRTRPRLNGTVNVKRIDAGPFFSAVDNERSPGAKKKKHPEPSPKKSTEAKKGKTVKTTAALDLDEPILTLESLQKIDAQLGLTIQEIVDAPATIRDASLDVTIENGKLVAPLTATVAEVPFNGNVSLAPEDNKPKIAIMLAADKSDIGGLARLLIRAEGVEGKFDTARLDLSARGETIRSLVETVELRFAIAGASLSYGHESGGNPVKFTLDKGEMVFPAADQSRINAKGSLLGEPFSMDLKGGTFIDNFVQRSWPIELIGAGGGAKLRIKGTVRRPESDTGTDLDFALAGKGIGGLARWIGVSPEAKAPYKLNGKAALSGKGIRFQIDKAQIGNSTFAGEIGIKSENDTPISFAKLEFNVIDLKELRGVLSQPRQTKKPETEHKALTIDIPMMPRGIEFIDSDIDIAVGRIKLQPAAITQIALSTRIRDGYVEKAPVEATITGARVEGSFAADLRGEVPKIDLDLQSRTVDIGEMLESLGVAEGLEMTAGRFHLNLMMKGASVRQILELSEFSAVIQDGLWTVHAPNTKNGLDIRIPTGSISAGGEKAIALALDGRIDTIPVKIDLATDPLVSFAKPKERLRMNINMALAGANLKFTGTAPLPVKAQNLYFRMDFNGNRFSDFDELLDVSLPPLGPYRLAGEFGSRENGYYVKNLQLKVGKSTLNGALELKTTETPPRLSVDLTANTVQLNDFDAGDWSAVGDDEQPVKQSTGTQKPVKTTNDAAKGRALLSPEVMHRLDARVTVNVNNVLSGQDKLGDGAMTAILEKGRFSIDPLKLNVPGGSVDAGFTLEPTNSDIGLETRVKIEKLDYGILARRIDPKSNVGGLISVDVDMKTRGPNIAGIMHHSNGRFDFAVWPKDLNAGIFDLWAVNLFVALMPSLDSGAGSKVNCAVGRFDIKDGVMRPTALLIDSTRIQATGNGTINFKTNTIDFRANPRSKRPQMFSAQTPIQVQGRFSDFKVGLPPGSLVGTAFRMITSPVTVPFKWVFTKKAPKDGKVACEKAWRRQPPSK